MESISGRTRGSRMSFTKREEEEDDLAITYIPTWMRRWKAARLRGC